MTDSWQDPFMVWARMDARALHSRADRARETARHHRSARRRRRSESPRLDRATVLRLRELLDP